MDIHSFQMYLCNVVFLTNKKLHWPINARTGVPAAVGLQGIVHLHPNGIFSRLHEIGNIYIKGGISVPMGTGELSVRVYLAVLIDALKVQHHGFSEHGSVQFKGLFVGISSAGEVAGVDTVAAPAVPLFQQHGIMGKVYRNGHSTFLTEGPIITEVKGHAFHRTFPLFHVIYNNSLLQCIAQKSIII